MTCERSDCWRLLKRLALMLLASVVSELEIISLLKEERSTALKAFLDGKEFPDWLQ